MAAIRNDIDIILQATSPRIITIRDPWFISGAPSNLPVIVNLVTSAVSSAGTIDITLNWAYTQPSISGAFTADDFILYITDGLTAPTTASPVLATPPRAARSFTIVGVVATQSFSFGIVARRQSSSAADVTAIVTGWVYDGSSAAPIEGLYNIAEFFSGKPAASKEILRLPMTHGVTFKTNLANSRCSSRVVATALIQFDIAKNGTNFGAMTFAAGGNIGTFASSSPTVFAFGDVLTVTTPTTADATLEDVGFMLAGIAS